VHFPAGPQLLKPGAAGVMRPGRQREAGQPKPACLPGAGDRNPMEQAADDRMPGPDSGCPGPGRSGGQVSGGQRVGGGGPRWPAGTRISQARPNAVGQSTAFAVILEDARMAELGQAARDEPIIFTPTNDSNPVPCRPQDAAEIDAGMADPYLTDCVHCKKLQLPMFRRWQETVC